MLRTASFGNPPSMTKRQVGPLLYPLKTYQAEEAEMRN
ncbi:unnamed protein product [Acanthoscelides obtectus]|uniref:Uncharacterized protein n=1 Tax=Acanthoscelides obtectus TaxID=200917 RepID=A0A9P0K906_ACAOB|nr:unnamed protein product [Acanthoscelides obtectus]CAK1646692.1 hypothetical protein AOBTE_LOCUS14820 [Acanthoscelides obtectus]